MLKPKIKGHYEKIVSVFGMLISRKLLTCSNQVPNVGCFWDLPYVRIIIVVDPISVETR